MSNRFKIGDYVIYDGDDSYWKIYKVLGIGEHYYKYSCLASSYSSTCMKGNFNKESLVGRDGRLVSKSEVTAFVLAKAL